MFSRETKASTTQTKSSKSDASGGSSFPSKFASSFQLGLSSRANASTSHPAWLKDGSSLKQLPGIYQGVLGQVQLQLALVNDNNKSTNGLDRLVASKQNQKQADYMDRFTDTERVHQLLSTSRLSNDTLATIWAHVNKTFPGQLTNREVCLALALIAIFQRLDEERARSSDSKDQDPFTLIKSERKPPVPKLHPNETARQTPTKSNQRLSGSSSMPSDLGTGGLLIDMGDEDETSNGANAIQTRSFVSHHNAMSLIDMDGDSEFELNFRLQTQVWLRFMMAAKALFKRSFDVLNVEHSRSSSLEALTSPKGLAFCKQLSVCYPIVHNIMFRVSELKCILRNEAIRDQTKHLLDGGFIDQMLDLMVSINEYWAVLINLFHESGLTEFLELIMDGLNRSHKTAGCETEDDGKNEIATLWAQIREELTCARRHDTCSICLTKFFLVNIGDALEGSANWQEDDVELVFDTKLITHDDCYYYHPKCANFWLNNVPYTEGKLPFQIETQLTSTILQPTSTCNSDQPNFI